MADKSTEAQDGKSSLSKVAKVVVTKTQDGKAVKGKIMSKRTHLKVVQNAIEGD